MVETEIWRPNDSVVFSPLDGSVALLDTERNVYYTLDGVGPFLWKQLSDGRSFSELCQAVELEYAVEPDVVRTDVSEWLGEMAAAGLIVDRDD